MDVRNMCISKRYIGFAGMIAIVVLLFDGSNSLYEVILGILFGGVLLLIAKVTKQSIGYADGIVMLIVGVLLGGSVSIVIFMIATFLLGIVGLCISIFKKTSLKVKRPLIPSIFVVYILWLIVV